MCGLSNGSAGRFSVTAKVLTLLDMRMSGRAGAHLPAFQHRSGEVSSAVLAGRSPILLLVWGDAQDLEAEVGEQMRQVPDELRVLVPGLPRQQLPRDQVR